LKAQAGFQKLQQKYAFIGDVRMYGLNGGIDIVDPQRSNLIRKQRPN